MTRACPVCGQSLDGRRPQTRCCSAACRAEASRLRRLLAGRPVNGAVRHRPPPIASRGFVWSHYQADFDQGLAELAGYVHAHGDARVPRAHITPSGFKLGGWCHSQRGKRKVGELSTERIVALDALGFFWDPYREDFDKGLEELAGYIHAHGDARVPTVHTTPTGFKLGAWCSNRRQVRKVGKLSAERIAALDALGFVWDARQAGSDRAGARASAPGKEGQKTREIFWPRR